jgi:hypothetical protein
MRHPIETVPRNGKVVVLEDEKTATVDVASWSAETLAWLSENGELCKITPTHWHTLRRKCESDGPSGSKAAAVDIVEDKKEPGEAQRAKPAWRRFAAASMAAILAASLIGMYFRTDVASYVTRHANLWHILRIGKIGGHVDQERQLESNAALAEDLAAARREMIASAAQYRQGLAEERDGGAALASELAMAQRDGDTQLKQIAESATVEQRQPRQKENDGAEALASELATTPRNADTQLKQVAESATVEHRQSPPKENDGAEALASELATTPRSADTPLKQAAESSSGRPAAVETNSRSEGARLLARANALLGQGNIGGARLVLERASETGSAEATFRLAETYDPLVLSTWKTYGTRGDVTKALELYAKAHAGGIQEAKDRSNALVLSQEGGDKRQGGKSTEFRAEEGVVRQ